MIVNTAEYCSETLPALEGSIKRMMDESFKEQVNLEDAHEEFSILLNQAVHALAAGICADLRRVLQNMTKLNWSMWESVGDQSSYVNEINALLKQSLPIVHGMVGLTYFPLRLRLVHLFPLLPLLVSSASRFKHAS